MNLVNLVILVILDAVWMRSGCGLDAVWHKCSCYGQTNERTIEDGATQPLNWKAEFRNYEEHIKKHRKKHHVSSPNIGVL